MIFLMLNWFDDLEKFGREKGESYPVVTIKDNIIFPAERVSLVMEDETVKKSTDKAVQENKPVLLIFQKDDKKSKIGVLARVAEHFDLAPGIIGLVGEGLRRIKIVREFDLDGVKMGEAKELLEEHKKGNETEIEALSRKCMEEFRKIAQTEGSISPIMIEDLQKEYLEPEKVSDLICAALRIDFKEKLELLETLDVRKRLEILSRKLASELSVVKTEEKIQHQIEEDVTKTQKEFVLRERLKAIEKELGMGEGEREFETLERKIIAAGLPKEEEVKVLGELRRLKSMPLSSPEVPFIRTYLEWVSDLPWNKKTMTEVDLQKAKEVLDADHYGLEKAKERVLEYLAIQKLTGGKSRGNILVFVGPPGTGKTSVGQSIAKALGRKFVRISLGGIRDEAEIRGHRRTYVGALPGRIIQGMKTAGTKNPVFMMDEIDKVGADFRGDPAAALLEVLDPAQNNSFSDHYIEIPFDLSEVFFITTANILDPVPPALRDRMEVIEFPGYTEDEKFYIARKFLFPRILTSTGLRENDLDVTDAAIKTIINKYTREAGVRDLERKLSEIARKVALEHASGKQKKQVVITERNLAEILGPEEFEVTTKEEQDEVGVSTGLAWTPAGGEIIFIESSLVPGKGNLTLTGQLGQVMQESARAALTYIRSRSEQLGFKDDFYYHSDIHVHVPEGAIPKDGPSSGIAIATALASMITGRKVIKEVALTGEVTLSGKVLKVGGIKEKVLAAHRGGAKVVVMPAGNEKNLIDIPKEIKKELDFKFVRHMDEVLDIALRK